MNSIILSKHLFKKAIEAYSPSDVFSHGITVSLLQDAAEMLIWHIAKYRNIDIKPKDGFVSLINNIDSQHGGVDLKPQIFELNSARVNFKHYGNIPSNVDVPKYIESCKQFLILNSHKIGVDFQTISSADGVVNEKIRGCLKLSEKHLEKEHYDKALTQSSIAFQELERIASNKVGIGSLSLDDIRYSHDIWPIDTRDSARDFTHKIANLFEKVAERFSLAQFGYSLEHVLSIKSMCVQVNISESGNILGTVSSNNTREEPDAIRYINEFVIEASRKI
ncbi:hypothetical protein [Aliiglaciecola aliphaticivorans]